MLVLVLTIALSPMAAYLMTMFWIAMFGDTFNTLADKSAIEEWIVCIALYIFVAIMLRFLRKS